MGKSYIIELVPLALFTLTDTLRKSDLPKPLARKGTMSCHESWRTCCQCSHFSFASNNSTRPRVFKHGRCCHCLYASFTKCLTFYLFPILALIPPFPPTSPQPPFPIIGCLNSSHTGTSLMGCRAVADIMNSTLFRYCFTLSIPWWLLPTVNSSSIMLILSPSDSQLDEELRLHAQEFQHPFSQVLISQGTLSQGTIPRAEPKCFVACQPTGVPTSLPRDIRGGRSRIRCIRR